MSKSIKKRIERIEETFQVDKRAPRLIIIVPIEDCDKVFADTLGDTHEWASYKQFIEANDDKGIICFQPDPRMELLARQRPLTPDELSCCDGGLNSNEYKKTD